MRSVLAPMRRLLLAVVLVAVAARADAQLLDVPPFIAMDETFELNFGDYTLAAASDSSLVVVTSRWTRDNHKQEAIAQRLASDGSPLGGPVRLDDTTDVTTPRVVADGRGGFIASWLRQVGLPLVARLLDGAGQPTTAPFIVASTTSFPRAVGGLPSGAVFVWTSSGDMLARLYDATGQPRGPAFPVASVTQHLTQQLGVADTGAGGFVIAWTDGGAPGVRGRLFDATGTPRGAVVELADEFELSTLVRDPLGGFVAVGRRAADSHARRSGVWARRFDGDGSPRGPSFVVEIADPEIAVYPRGAFDPSGRLYLTWGYGASALLSRGRAYDPSGRPLHASFRTMESFTAFPMLAARPDGRFVEGRLASGDLELQVRALCVPPDHTSCGDGVVTAPCERCDDGAANSDTSPNACRTTCATAACGDGVVDHNETCDDGNLLGCDGCDSECNLEVGWVCGDGQVSADCEEQCDDGPANDDALPNACRTDCRRAYCGDGVLDTGEACDDGNRTSCDGCSDLCIAEPGLVCGDGIPELLCGEQCDDANAIVGDGCTAPCRLERIPGGGAPTTDCLTEWVADNPSNVPRFDKNGVISGVQACVDGDPACDFDGGVAGSCTFHLRVCTNNTDIAGCEGHSRLQSWTLKAPSAAKAAKRPALAAVRAAFASVPGAIVGTPLPDACSGTLAVPVPVRASAAGARKPGILVLKSYATRYTGERDSDKIKLICLP